MHLLFSEWRDSRQVGGRSEGKGFQIQPHDAALERVRASGAGALRLGRHQRHSRTGRGGRPCAGGRDLFLNRRAREENRRGGHSCRSFPLNQVRGQHTSGHPDAVSLAGTDLPIRCANPATAISDIPPRINTTSPGVRRPRRCAPSRNPRLLFERLFGAGPPSERKANFAAPPAAAAAILDFVLDDRIRERNWPRGTNRNSDEYLASVRKSKTHFQKPRRESGDVPKSAGGRSRGIPASL